MSLDIYLQCEHCQSTLASYNATHNLAPMWRQAGIRDALYESEGKRASEIFPILLTGLHAMQADSTTYRKLNPENGWGNYDGALEFLRDVVDACDRHPNALIHVWA